MIKNNDTRTVQDGDDTHTLEKGNQSVTLKTGDQTTVLKQGNQSLTLEMGNQDNTLKMGNQSTTLEMGNQDTTLKMGNQTTAVKLGNISSEASLGKIAYEAMQSIELKVGQNSITIDQTGVTIKGMMVSVEAQLQAEVKGVMTTVQGDGMLTVKGGITMINCDLALDLLGRVARPLGDDLDLGRREIGIGIDRQGMERPDATHDGDHAGRQHDEALPERHGDELVDHLIAPGFRRTGRRPRRRRGPARRRQGRS